MARDCLLGVNIPDIPGISSSNIKARHTLVNKMDCIEEKLSLLKTEEASDTTSLSDETNRRSVTATPSTSSGCCRGKDSYFSSPMDTP